MSITLRERAWEAAQAAERRGDHGTAELLAVLGDNLPPDEALPSPQTCACLGGQGFCQTPEECAPAQRWEYCRVVEAFTEHWSEVAEKNAKSREGWEFTHSDKEWNSPGDASRRTVLYFRRPVSAAPPAPPYTPIEARRFEPGQEAEAIAALESGSVVRIPMARGPTPDQHVNESWITPECWRRMCEAKWPADDGR